MTIAAVILNWNRADLTETATQSVAPEVDRVYIVDNGSVPSDVRRLRQLSRGGSVALIENGANLGYAGGNNRGIEAALRDCHEAVFVMNNDVRVREGALVELLRRLRSTPHVGVVAPVVIDAGGDTVLHTACDVDTRLGRTAWQDSGKRLADIDPAIRPTGYVSGEAFLTKGAVFRAVGLLDEAFHCYFEDVDWSVRVQRHGWRMEVVPAAVVEHEVGASGSVVIGQYYRARNRLFFLRRTLGRSRPAAAALSLCPMFVTLASLLRRGRFHAASSGALKGWLAGIVRG